MPTGEVPVLELSIDIKQPLEYHYKLGKKLFPLREQGIFFIGSGNLIHTFREVQFKKDVTPFKWASVLDELQKQAIDTADLDLLLDHQKASLKMRGFQTLDHYIPMLYILGMKQPNEIPHYIYEGIQHGSVSHRSFVFSN